MKSVIGNTLSLAAKKPVFKSASQRVVVTKAASKDGFPGIGTSGSCAPLGPWDPLNISSNRDAEGMKLFREAELTHGRVAMVASVGFIVGENFNPFFDGEIKGPAIGHFQQLPTQFWVVVLAAVGIAEFARLTTGWVSPAEGKGFWKLQDDYVPGSIGWDPLGLKPTDAAELETMQLRELNNGRLAMFAIAGEIVQELVTGKELFNLEDDGLLNDANCVGGICDILESSG